MKEIKVKAVFKGENGSSGYETNKEYTLMVCHGNLNIHIENREASSFGNGYCEYQSINSFLENWDNIRVIKEEKRKPLFITEDGVEIFENEGYWIVSKDHEEFISYFNTVPSVKFLKKDTKRFSTKQAAEEWIATQKPKSLKPEELVDGEIYVLVVKNDTRIFRFDRLNNSDLIVVHSQLLDDGIFYNDGTWTYDNGFISIATLSQKQILIKKEIKNGYFHELKNQK